MHKPDVLLKPVVEKELKFYQFLQSAVTTQEVVRIRDFVPHFHGVMQLRNPLHSGKYSTPLSVPALQFPIRRLYGAGRLCLSFPESFDR